MMGRVILKVAKIIVFTIGTVFTLGSTQPSWRKELFGNHSEKPKKSLW